MSIIASEKTNSTSSALVREATIFFAIALPCVIVYSLVAKAIAGI